MEWEGEKQMNNVKSKIGEAARRVAGVVNRDPSAGNRDPKGKRRIVKIGQPAVCPECNCSVTRQSSGSYKDPVNQVICEYRTCARCGTKMGCNRKMTQYEVEKYCTHVDVVKEYQG